MRCDNDSAFENIEELMQLLPKIANDIENAIIKKKSKSEKYPKKTIAKV